MRASWAVVRSQPLLYHLNQTNQTKPETNFHSSVWIMTVFIMLVLINAPLLFNDNLMRLSFGHGRFVRKVGPEQDAGKINNLTNVVSGFGKHPANSGLIGFLFKINVLKGGEHDNGSFWTDAFQLGSDFNAIHVGHAKVEDDKLGMKFLSFFEGIAAAVGFGADGPFLVILKDISQDAAHDFVVVDDH